MNLQDPISRGVEQTVALSSPLPTILPLAAGTGFGLNLRRMGLQESDNLKMAPGRRQHQW